VSYDRSQLIQEEGEKFLSELAPLNPGYVTGSRLHGSAQGNTSDPTVLQNGQHVHQIHNRTVDRLFLYQSHCPRIHGSMVLVERHRDSYPETALNISMSNSTRGPCPGTPTDIGRSKLLITHRMGRWGWKRRIQVSIPEQIMNSEIVMRGRHPPKIAMSQEYFPSMQQNGGFGLRP